VFGVVATGSTTALTGGGYATFALHWQTRCTRKMTTIILALMVTASNGVDPCVTYCDAVEVNYYNADPANAGPWGIIGFGPQVIFYRDGRVIDYRMWDNVECPPVHIGHGRMAMSWVDKGFWGDVQFLTVIFPDFGWRGITVTAGDPEQEDAARDRKDHRERPLLNRRVKREAEE